MLGYLRGGTAIRSLVVTWSLVLTLSTSGVHSDTLTIDPAALVINLQPQRMDIVLVGQQSNIKVTCDNSPLDLWLSARPRTRGVVKMVVKDVPLAGNATAEEELQIRIFGIKSGRSKLDLVIVDSMNKSVVGVLPRDYEVVVVERVNVMHDAFMYVILSSQVMTLFMLSFRMRGAAVKEGLRRPCALLSALFCQAILMPLVSIGVSVSLSLPIHSVVCLLILGCCPTGMLSPMLAVVQQAHVELAVLLTLLETTTAFGIMPLWLFTYGNFLGLAYDHVSGPYFYIAGAMATVAAPLVAGLLIQRCGPTVLPRLDRAIPPICLLLLLMEFTVSAISFGASWSLVTWRLLVGTALLPVVGCILGIITTATFKQKLPQTKTVAIVTCVQNTVLAKVIIQMSYPTSDASVMAVTLNCVEFFTVCFMILAYIPHVTLTFCWSPYRPLHQHGGIGGLQDSISDQIVRSMIKAGEITFGKLQQSPRLRTVEYPKIKSSNTLNTLGSFSGRLLYSGNSLDSAYRSNGGSASGGRATPSTPTAASYPLRYFTDSSPEFPQRGGGGKAKRSSDSLESLDYEMLTGKTVLPGGVSTPESDNVLYDVSQADQEQPPSSSTDSPFSKDPNLNDSTAHGDRLKTPLSQESLKIHRIRHMSGTSSRSACSDNTQATSVSSRTDAASLEEVRDELEAGDHGVFTVSGSYDISSPPDTDLQTRSPWEADGGNASGPMTSLPPRNSNRDDLCIGEDNGPLNVDVSSVSKDLAQETQDDSMLLSY